MNSWRNIMLKAAYLHLLYMHKLSGISGEPACSGWSCCLQARVGLPPVKGKFQTHDVGNLGNHSNQPINYCNQSFLPTILHMNHRCLPLLSHTWYSYQPFLPVIPVSHSYKHYYQPFIPTIPTKHYYSIPSYAINSNHHDSQCFPQIISGIRMVAPQPLSSTRPHVSWRASTTWRGYATVLVNHHSN
jgi:hypothetical protein